MNSESNNQEIEQQDRIVENDTVVSGGAINNSDGKLKAATDPLVGSILGGHLKIVSCIGAGGMSVVYKAEDLLLNRVVAVKILHSHSALNPQNILRFRQEAMAASKIDHANVIRVYEFNVPDQGQPYLVMDFIEGLSLADFLKQNGAIEMRRAISLMGIICDGLQCAHDAGVIHRDLKPGNIMLLKDSTGTQTLKIVDFGIAKVLTENKEGHALTQTGEVFGSPLYMSPEQCFGRTLDTRSDMYSIGCVMYEMCTGQPPIKGDSMLETIQRQTTDMPAPSAAVYPGIKYSAQFDQIIERAMAKVPEERFQSPPEFKKALLNMLDSPEPNEVKQRRKKLILKVLIGCGLTACAAFAIFYLYRPKGTLPMVHETDTTAVTSASVNSKAESKTARLQQNREGGIKCRTAADLAALYHQPADKQPMQLITAHGDISDQALTVIKDNAKLKVLKAMSSPITDLSGPTIGSLQHLQEIDVGTTRIGNKFLKSIGNLKELWYLYCSNTNVNADGMDYLTNLPLHVLNIGADAIGDVGLSKISNLPLEELLLTHTDVTGAGLQCLEKMHTLRVLLAGKNAIGSEGVHHLKKMTQLARLGLENANVTDADVKELTEALINLEYLNLADNNISAKSLDYVSRLPKLRTLRISKSDIPQSEISKFKQAHPKIRINEK